MFISCFLLLFGSLWSLAASDELFVFLTQESGVYKLYYTTSDKAPWQTFNVPSDIKMIQDVEFNYATESFYFSSAQPLQKGLWKANMTMEDHFLSQQLRDDSTPQKITIYPEYDIALFYDQGYSLVIEISLINEVNDLRIKSLFQPADRLDGIYFLDRKTNLVYAQPDDQRGILFASSLNGSLLTSYPFPARQGKNANITAYDNDAGVVYYCANGYLNAMRLSDSMIYQTSNRLPCNPIATDNGALYFTSLQNGYIQKLAFQPSGAVINSDKFLRLPFAVNIATNVITFKHYSYGSKNIIHQCTAMECDQICLPAGSGTPATCTCMDYYTLAKNNNSITKTEDSPCEKETLSRPGVFYAVYNISFATDATLFYRLEGDPAIWTRRPQREQLFTISSDVAAVTYDWIGQRIFAVALRYRQIMSARLDGTFITAGHYSGISPNVKTIGYDWVGGNVIWFDPVFKWLRIVPVTTSTISNNIFKTAMVNANIQGYALRLDSVAGYLFFLEYDDLNTTISLWRTLMDGSEPNKIYSFPQSVFSDSIDDSAPDVPLPGALNIDYYNKHVWVAFVNDMFVLSYDGILVYSTKIGTSAETIYNSRVVSLSLYNTTYALVVVKRTDAALSTLYAYAIVRKPDGSCCNSLINSYNKIVYGQYRALTNYEAMPTPSSSLNCTVLNCQYMCTNIRGYATCLCPDDFTWDSTSKTCKPKIGKELLTPSVVFTAADRACFRNIRDQTGYSGRTTFNTYDNCTSIGFASGPSDSPRSLEVDPFTFKAYVLQLLTNPRTTFRVNLAAAQKNAYSPYNFMTALGQLAFNLLSNTTWTASEVFYSAVLTNYTGQAAVAFDWLGRNVYIGDQSNGRLLVARDDFSNPLIIAFNINFTSMTIDPLRRKLYWSVGLSTGGSLIYQSDLDANNGSQCVIAKLDQNVVEMDISHYNQTLLFLTQPNNQIGRIMLRRLSPFVPGCPSTPPIIQFNTLAKANVSHFAVYRSMIFFTCGYGDNCAQKVFASTSLGQTVDNEVTVYQDNRKVQLSSLAVFDPQLLNFASNSSTYAAKDKCASLARGQCDQFCLSSWPPVGNTTANCYCSDGMVLMNDGRTCGPRYIDTTNKGILFTPDDYRHEVFGMPITAIDKPLETIKNMLTTFKINTKARPYAVAYDYVADNLYYSDFERGAIYRINPNKQMSNGFSSNGINELFIDFQVGTRAYGLFVDPASRVLFFTVRDNRTLYAADLITKKVATVKTFTGNIFGITMDRRADKLQLYVSLRNNSNVVQLSNSPAGNGTNRIVAKINPFTWSSIVRVAPDGSNYEVMVNFTAIGPDVQTVPWIYDLAIDYPNNRLFFSTGQNRSIMYLNLRDLAAPPQLFWVSKDNSSFLYGMQVINDVVLSTDWGRGGIHIHNKNTAVKVGSLGPQYLIGVNGIAIYSPAIENSFQLNSACSSDRFCSHVCVPLVNNQRKCICPDGVATIDGVNCPGVPTCPKPPSTLGTMDSKCAFRSNSPCTINCSAANTALDPSVRAASFPIACNPDGNNVPKWCTDLTNICRAANAPLSPDLNKCIQQAETLAIQQAAGDNTSDSSGSLHPGVIAAIVIACLLVAAAIGVVGFFGWKKYRPFIVQHVRFDVPVVGISSRGSGLPHLDEIGVPDSFRYRNLQEGEAHNVST